nr:MAG TPA: Helix-turn-helix of DDE superfamily endonuclease [Caudoviricetes sp.]
MNIKKETQGIIDEAKKLNNQFSSKPQKPVLSNDQYLQKIIARQDKIMEALKLLHNEHLNIDAQLNNKVGNTRSLPTFRGKLPWNVSSKEIYLLYSKGGYSINEICLLSGYTKEQVESKIDSYCKSLNIVLPKREG